MCLFFHSVKIISYIQAFVFFNFFIFFIDKVSHSSFIPSKHFLISLCFKKPLIWTIYIFSI